jgi:hypothetical protein
VRVEEEGKKIVRERGEGKEESIGEERRGEERRGEERRKDTRQHG